MSVQIPKLLWDTLQTAFQMEAKRICRDAARLLGANEKELIQKVMPPQSKVKVQLVQDEEAPLSCPVLLSKGTLLRRCRAPSLLGTGRCLHHQTATIPATEDLPIQLTRLERIEERDDALWCNEATGEVYDEEGAIIGEYRDERLILYVLEDE